MTGPPTKPRASFDLDAYLARIRLDGRPTCDADGLAALQQAHRRAIAFENLDVMLGRPIRIDSASAFDKLVRRGRGGYCFEQNRLFADALATLGFGVRPLLARVLLGAGPHDVTPLTHVVLLVDLDGEPWLADAGFGGSFTPPMRLADGEETRTEDGARHRLLRSGALGSLNGEWRLERAGPPAATDGRAAPHSDWQPQYVLDLREVATDDLEVSNHWTSTRPGTRFTTLHVASIALPTGYASLNQRRLTVCEGAEVRIEDITDAGHHRQVLADRFGLCLSVEEVAGLPLWQPFHHPEPEH